MKYPRLSPEDEKLFLHALDHIWNSVGPDCLTGVAEEKGIRPKRTDYGTLMPNEQVTVPRSTVLSIVTDQFAGHSLQEFSIEEETWQRIRTWMLSVPGHIVDKVAAKQFPEKRFGM